jgi:hypothetical protein
VDANFSIGPINWQLELVQGRHWVLHGRHPCIRTLVLQLELDQGINEFNVDANFANGPID